MKGQTVQRKQFLRWAGWTLGGAFVGVGLTGCGGGEDVPVERAGAGRLPTALGSALSAEEIADLFYLREEEKLAHDVYVALYARWGTPVFNSIAQSESQHTEAVRQRILDHGLVDPAADTPPGVFVNDDLQVLYDTLVQRGQASLIAALEVGCLIEEKDIQDLTEMRSQAVGEPDIVAVHDRLLCGSRNHLRAFNRQLVAQGGSYVAQVISQADWNAIANAELERCGA